LSGHGRHILTVSALRGQPRSGNHKSEIPNLNQAQNTKSGKKKENPNRGSVWNFLISSIYLLDFV
jgi:hypothetical protein